MRRRPANSAQDAVRWSGRPGTHEFPRGPGAPARGRSGRRNARPPGRTLCWVDGVRHRTGMSSRRPRSTKVKAALFQSVDPAGRRLTVDSGWALSRRLVLAQIKWRAAPGGVCPPSTCCHTFSGDRERKPVRGRRDVLRSNKCSTSMAGWSTPQPTLSRHWSADTSCISNELQSTAISHNPELRIAPVMRSSA